MSLTPEEMEFFETGDASKLQPELPDLSALANPDPTPPKVEPTPPIEEPLPEPQAKLEPSPDVAEILRRSLAEAQQKVAELEQSIKQQQKQTQQPEEEPDPTTDPLGHLLHKINKLTSTVTQLQETQQQTTQLTTQQQAFNTFKQQVQAMRDEFKATHPDFDTAYSYMRQQREADLKAFGLTPEQVRNTVLQEEFALSERAIREAKNPAEVLYEMSKRHGYVPKQAAASVQPEEKAAQVARAQAAAAQKPSAPPSSELDLTLEGLKNASDADLNKLILDPAAWAKIAGTDQHPI